jgi:hypothetical protein
MGGTGRMGMGGTGRMGMGGARERGISQNGMHGMCAEMMQSMQDGGRGGRPIGSSGSLRLPQGVAEPLTAGAAP